MELRAPLIALATLATLGSPGIAGAQYDLESRVARLERILSNQSLSDMLLQVQRLQDEVQRLRGKVEVQQHDIELLQRQLQASSPRPAADRLSPDDEAGGAGPPVDEAAPPADEKALYQTAFDLLKQRRYEEAISAFDDLLKRYPQGQFADNAHYWLGETYYVKQDYADALAEFQRVIDRYPLSLKVPGALLKIGYIHYDQGDWTAARDALKAVIRKFPDTNESGFAQSRLNRMAREGHSVAPHSSPTANRSER